MKCPECQSENREDARFCEDCGDRLPIKCPSCGAFIQAGKRFCGDCGQPLQEITQKASETPTETPAMPTTFAHDRYQIKEILGEGGKKKVYLAYDTLLDRDIALALIKTEGLDEDAKSRITREAQAMGRVGTHENIVMIFDLGDIDGQPSLEKAQALRDSL